MAHPAFSRSLCLLLLPASLFGQGRTAFSQTRWMKARSSNFEIYSGANEPRTRELLRELEQLRAFFLESTRAALARRGVTYVTAFKTAEDYERYRPDAKTLAFPVLGTDRDQLVIGPIDSIPFDRLAAAYAGMLVKQSAAALPKWLERELPEFFSTATARAGLVSIGDISPARRKALLSQEWISLEVLAAAAEPNSAEAVALLHLLLLSPEYSPGFPKLASPTGPEDFAARLTGVYGKSLAEIDQDLRTWVHSDHFLAKALPAVVDLPILTTERAPGVDINLALAGVVNRPGRDSEARAWFERLKRDEAANRDVWSGAAYLAVRMGDQQAARDAFEQAFALGQRDPQLLWDYARLTHGDPDDARLKLAAQTLDQRKPASALEILKGAADVPDYQVELAYAQAGAGLTEDAKQTLARWSDQDAPETTRLLEAVNGAAPVVLTAAAPAPPQSQEDPAAIEEQKALEQAELLTRQAAELREEAAALARSRGEGETKRKPGSDSPLVRAATEARSAEPPNPAAPAIFAGNFVELGCGDQIRVVVDGEEGRKTFLIRDPSNVQLEGKAADRVELTCGPQPPTRVRVQFSPGTAPFDGSVLGIVFE